MVKKGKSWEEKLRQHKEIKIKRIDKKFADVPADSNLLIPTPKIIDEYINRIPEGKKAAVKTMRNDLALTYGADHTCPVTTGIFLRIVAEAAYERWQSGNDHAITPFWRVLDAQSKLADKLTFDKSFLIRKREEEGIC